MNYKHLITIFAILLFLPAITLAQSAGSAVNISNAETRSDSNTASSIVVPVDDDDVIKRADDYRDQFGVTAEFRRQSGNEWRYELKARAPSPNYRLSVETDGAEVVAIITQTSGSAPQISTALRANGSFRVPTGIEAENISFQAVDAADMTKDDWEEADKETDEDVADNEAASYDIDLEIRPRRSGNEVGVRANWQPHPEATGYQKKIFRQDIYGSATNVRRVRGGTRLASGMFASRAEDEGYCYYFEVTVYPLKNGERIDGAADTADECVMAKVANEPGRHPDEHTRRSAVPHTTNDDERDPNRPDPIENNPEPELPLGEDRATLRAQLERLQRAVDSIQSALDSFRQAF